MYCHACGTTISEDARFCPKCGAAQGTAEEPSTVPADMQPLITEACGNCHARLLPNATSCAVCGRPVKGRREPPPTWQPSRTTSDRRGLWASVAILVVIVVAVLAYWGSNHPSAPPARKSDALYAQLHSITTLLVRADRDIQAGAQSGAATSPAFARCAKEFSSATFKIMALPNYPNRYGPLVSDLSNAADWGNSTCEAVTSGELAQAKADELKANHWEEVAYADFQALQGH